MENLKILIIEDESLIAHDIEGLLTDWGYHVTGIAASGEEALALFTKEQPDIALIDVQLNGQIDGIELAHKFNALHRIPLVYLTAQADSKTLERAKTTNPAAYLLKPFNEQHLHISLELAINNFYKISPPQYPSAKYPVFAHEVKLGADVILKSGNTFFIKQSYRFVKLQIEDLLYVEADSNHAYLVMKHQKFIVRMTLGEIIERLNCLFLVRVHRSFAINIQLVEEFDDSSVVINGKTIPLTGAYKADFLKKFSVI